MPDSIIMPYRVAVRGADEAGVNPTPTDSQATPV